MGRWAVPRYTEFGPVGWGGFGAVMLAVDDVTGTRVAVRYLRPELLGDPGFVALFRAGAVVLGSVDDRHVVRLYEYVEAPAGAAIVMELVDGVSLRPHRAGQDGPVAPRRQARSTHQPHGPRGHEKIVERIF